MRRPKPIREPTFEAELTEHDRWPVYLKGDVPVHEIPNLISWLNHVMVYLYEARQDDI